MNYMPLRKGDFDTTLKYGKDPVLGYSEKKLNELHPDKDYRIVAQALDLVNKRYRRAKKNDMGSYLILGKSKIPVIDTEDEPHHDRSAVCYVPVDEENDYVEFRRRHFIGHLMLLLTGCH